MVHFHYGLTLQSTPCLRPGLTAAARTSFSAVNSLIRRVGLSPTLTSASPAHIPLGLAKLNEILVKCVQCSNENSEEPFWSAQGVDGEEDKD